jgi:ABC-type transporter Mla subunit MlaD
MSSNVFGATTDVVFNALNVLEARCNNLREENNNLKTENNNLKAQNEVIAGKLEDVVILAMSRNIELKRKREDLEHAQKELAESQNELHDCKKKLQKFLEGFPPDGKTDHGDRDVMSYESVLRFSRAVPVQHTNTTGSDVPGSAAAGNDPVECASILVQLSQDHSGRSGNALRVKRIATRRDSGSGAAGAPPVVPGSPGSKQNPICLD